MTERETQKQGLARYSGLAGDRRALSERLRAATQTEEVERRELERQDVDIGTHREAVDLLEASLGQLRDELAELEASRREQESARLYQGRESQQLQERIERLTAACDQSKRDLEAGSARRKEAQAEHDQVVESSKSVRMKADTAKAAAESAEVAEAAVLGDGGAALRDGVRHCF